MILGTHNSGTGEELVWWQRPFSWLINPFSQCQSRTVSEQLINGVKLFDMHITYYRKEWRLSNGCSIYKTNFLDVIKTMKKHSSSTKPIYYKLYLDKNPLTGQNVKKFEELIAVLKEYSQKTNVKLLYAWVEGTEYYPYISSKKLDIAEHYWTKTWARNKSLFNKIPLPKRHAKKYNKEYRENNTSDYLMLDFYEYK